MPRANPFIDEVVERLGAATGLEAGALRGMLTQPPSADLGDVAFPCFQLAKARKLPPPKLAQELATGEFAKASALIAGARAAGPYLNLSFERAAFTRWVLSAAAAAGASWGSSDAGAGRTVVIDYSSPNIAKPFHVGHLRSTIIGGALYRLFARLGYRVVGVNHLGDWGTQFGKVIVGLKRWGSDRDLEDVFALSQLYVRANEEEGKDPSLAAEARDWFRRQEAGDAEALGLWRKIRATSLAYFQRIYDRIGARFDSFDGESFFNDKMAEVIALAERAGLTEVSEGALIVPLKAHGIETPALLRKADGSTLYLTRDLAAALHRQRAYGFSKLLYVIGTEQSLHLQQLFKVCELLGWAWAKDCVHVGFGRVQGMSSRKGNVIYLEELLDEAKRRALANMQANAERRPEVDDPEAVAEAVGTAAIFFSDLANRRIKDYVFDWDRAISFQGDTGPYLLNARARIAGIIRKSGVELPASLEAVRYELLAEPSAHRLVSQVARCGDVLEQAAADYEPALLAGYLLDLAKALHASYVELRVKGEAQPLAEARLLLMKVVKDTLAGGLAVLGIPALERM